MGSFEHGEVADMGKFVNYRGVGNSKQNGEGTETWADGAVYQGHFKDGKYLWVDKAKYEGDFHNNNLEGKGRYVWSDGV